MKEADIDVLTLDKLEKAKEQHIKEEKEKEEKFMKNTYNKTDYAIRARREEHLKILAEEWKNAQSKKDEILKAHKATFERELKFKETIAGVQAFRDAFVKKELEARKSEYQKQLSDFKEKIINDFKDQILKSANDSLKAQKEAEEAEFKKAEEERQKQIERIKKETVTQVQETNKISRNAQTRSDMQSASENTKTAPSAGSSGGFRSGFTRGEAKKEDEKSNKPDAGYQPKFTSKKTEGGPIQRNIGGASSTITANNSTVDKKDAGQQDGWRTVEKKKTDEKRPENKFVNSSSTGSGWRANK